jgi:hypothetical protein
MWSLAGASWSPSRMSRASPAVLAQVEQGPALPGVDGGLGPEAGLKAAGTPKCRSSWRVVSDSRGSSSGMQPTIVRMVAATAVAVVAVPLVPVPRWG